MDFELKPYKAFDYNVPFDADFLVPNYYFRLFTPIVGKVISLSLHSDDFYVKLGDYGSKKFSLWLPADQGYKDFDYFLVVNDEKTKPTYICTLSARPKIIWTDDAYYITLKFYLRNQLKQHVIIDKSKMRVIYLYPLNKGVENGH